MMRKSKTTVWVVSGVPCGTRGLLDGVFQGLRPWLISDVPSGQCTVTEPGITAWFISGVRQWARELLMLTGMFQGLRPRLISDVPSGQCTTRQARSCAFFEKPNLQWMSSVASDLFITAPQGRSEISQAQSAWIKSPKSNRVLKGRKELRCRQLI